MKKVFPWALVLAPPRIQKQSRPAGRSGTIGPFGVMARNFVERGLSSDLRFSISPSADHQRRAARTNKTKRTMRTMLHATFVA
jgi:hypothetical protein